ncbi:MAG: WD40 repeat domain-containing protein [Terriglobales bacterium]
MASAGADGSIRLWDIQSGKGTVRTLTGHTAPVTKIVFSPDGRRLASASEDGTIRMWEVGG